MPTDFLINQVLLQIDYKNLGREVAGERNIDQALHNAAHPVKQSKACAESPKPGYNQDTAYQRPLSSFT